MKKVQREGEKIIRELGFKIISTGRTKHHFWILRSPTGKQFKQVIPHNPSDQHFWGNWKSQLRKHLNDDYTINPLPVARSGDVRRAI